MTDNKVSGDGLGVDLDGIVSKIVLQQPWNGGYGGFEGFGIVGRSFNKPQISYLNDLNALVIRAGHFYGYDDAGWIDASWGIVPEEIAQLAIPAANLMNLINNRKFSREMIVPCEYVKQNGRFVFGSGPVNELSAEDERAIKQDHDFGIPALYGISCEFSYGTLKLTLVPREDKKIGIIVGEYVSNKKVANQRDADFFSGKK